MTWSRLFWVRNVPKAFSRVIPGKPLQQLAISKRYQAEIRKLYRVNGVPWLYNADQVPTINPRDKLPKPKKRQAKKQIRLKKIQAALKQSEQKIIQFRQTRLNGRPLGGMDRLIIKALPSWIKGEDGERRFKKKQRTQ